MSDRGGAVANLTDPNQPKLIVRFHRSEEILPNTARCFHQRGMRITRCVSRHVRMMAGRDSSLKLTRRQEEDAIDAVETLRATELLIRGGVSSDSLLQQRSAGIWQLGRIDCRHIAAARRAGRRMGLGVRIPSTSA